MTHQVPSTPFGGLSDDQLGTVAVSLVVGELHWTPDVATAVMDRVSRDAVAYPEHFGRNREPSAAAPAPPAQGRSLGRTLARLAVIAAIIALVVVVIFVAATANAAAMLVPGADDPVTSARILLSLLEVR
jgi:hypothetical protein